MRCMRFSLLVTCAFGLIGAFGLASVYKLNLARLEEGHWGSA